MCKGFFIKQNPLLYVFLLVSFLGTFLTLSETSADTTAQQTNTPPSAMVPAPGISLVIGDQTEFVDEHQINAWLTIQIKLGIDTRYRSEIENTRLCPLDTTFCDFILSQKTRTSLRTQSVELPDKKAIGDYLNTLNTKFSKDPVDAKFTVTDNKISLFSLSQDGSRIDTDKSVPLIANALTQESSGGKDVLVELPLITLKPDHQSSDADSFGIVTLIGEGRTSFAGSPKNRIHNFTRALEQFNGIMIAPQEEFSFVKFLGDVDAEHGYLPELVIKENKTEPEFGGGICQVSTTVFRAAIYSGLKITARRNHAYPVSYYKPYGMDATVYIPRPDLRFINNTPGHILMQTAIEGSQLIFRFYGTSDGRTTEVDGPHILEHNPDGSMKTIFTQKVTDAQGNTIINDDFRSNYASPSKFPHPGQEPLFTQKPADWSQTQWSDYKKLHTIP
jgi:vancomycin resistance protein YoaR